VLVSIIVPTGDRYPAPESRAPLWSKILEAVRQIPGVESAGTVDALPFSGENGATAISAEPFQTAGAEPLAEVDTVSAEYLQTMGVKLLQGRWFREEDVRTGRTVAMVDEIAARALWPQGGAVGRRICVDCVAGQLRHWYDVVGVVRSLRHRSLDDDAGPAVYLTSQAYEKADFLVVRAQHADTAQLAQAVRRAVASADPDQPILLGATMSTLIGDSIADRRFLYLTLSITGMLALLLAAAGVYGVVSHATSQRMREIGIRMAIGATPRQIAGLIFKQGMRPVVLGVATGSGLAIAATKLTRGAVSGLASPGAFLGMDSRVFLLAVGLVVFTAGAACVIPARRAAKLHPMAGLRQD
jgi:putative ABC transport system permease protein